MSLYNITLVVVQYFFSHIADLVVEIDWLNQTVRHMTHSNDRRSMDRQTQEVEPSPTQMAKGSGNRRFLYLATGSTIAFVLYSVFILEPVSKCFTLEDSSNSLGLRFTYTLQMVQDFFELRSQDQLDCYVEFLQIWDVMYAVVYASMYCFWIMYFYHDRPVFLVVPVLAMVADWAENFVEVMMINRYLDSNTISDTLVSVGSGLNMIKWVFFSLTYLIITLGICTKIKSVIRQSKKE